MKTPVQVGRYEIIEELGRGAMGVVYRAKDPAMGRIVALKTIISVALEGPQGAEFRERFFREARTAGGLAHPGIVAMFDVGEHEGTPYMVMEHITGSTLSDYAKGRDRLSMDRICELGSQIAEALSFAHQRGIVHRDIKPANILMTSPQAHGIERPKITDFGVAKLAEGHTTLTGQMVGTPAYMPPEQFTGAAIDGRSDLFSLGVLLYWMATGEQPFPGESITAVSYKIVQTDPIPPRRLNPSVPARLESIILKCLEKSPDERFQNGDDLARELTAARKPSTGATLVPSEAKPKFDPDATMVEPLGGSAAASPAPAAKAPAKSAAPAVVAAAAGKKPQPSWALVAGLCVVAVATAGWFVMRPSPPAEPAAGLEASAVATNPGVPSAPSGAADAGTTAPATAAPVAGGVPPAAPAAATLLQMKKSAPVQPASVAKSAAMPVDSKPVEVKAAPPAKKPAAPAVVAPVPVDFDPRALDRKTNARIEFDAGRMPAPLAFTVEMNGRVYYEKTGATAYKKDGDFYLPPGVQEFQVRARSGAVEKVSNTVSTEFKANKRSTLKIELRIQGKPADAGMPGDLYPDSQLVLTLK